MSDEPEARMWDEGSSRYDSGDHGVYFESAFASSEHLDRAPLLSEETYTDIPVSGRTPPTHCHWNPQTEPRSAVNQLLMALVLCGLFMIAEVIGGFLAGSLSVMCDAAHMLSDCGGFALALLAFHCAKRQPDLHMSYGYKRAEVLGAMVSVLLIWILTGVFVYVAAVRLHTRDFDIEPDAMMIVSGCGVAFNVVLAVVLHGCSGIAHLHSHGGAACTHGPGHGHTHTPTQRSRFGVFRRQKQNGALANGDYGMKDLAGEEAHVVNDSHRNINLRAALIHVLGDLIQSCGVLLASILIKFYPEAKIVDPICTFLFSVLVLLTSTRVVRDALAMLMQAVPNDFRYREFVQALSALGGVRHVHSVHAWALSSHHVIVSAHVAIDELTDPEPVLLACQQLAQEYGARAGTFQVERYSSAMLVCVPCRQPGHVP